LCTYYLLLPTIGTAIDVVLIGAVLQSLQRQDQTRPDQITSGFDSQLWHSAKCTLPSSVMLLLLLVVVVVVVVVVVAAGSFRKFIHLLDHLMASSSIHHMIQGGS